MNFWDFVLTVFVTVLSFILVKPLNQSLCDGLNVIIARSHLLLILERLERMLDKVKSSCVFRTESDIVWCYVVIDGTRYCIPFLREDNDKDVTVTLITGDRKRVLRYPAGIKFTLTAEQLQCDSVTVE